MSKVKHNLNDSYLQSLTEEHIKAIVDKSIREALNEMAVPLKDYKARVDGLRFQLVENWCLCKWCQLFNTNSKNLPHWCGELKACINNLKLLDIKNNIDKRKTLRRLLVDDYDYDKPNMIMRIIRDKFDDENIMDEIQRVRVATEFADNIQCLIDVISIDSISTKLYIEKNFAYDIA